MFQDKEIVSDYLAGLNASLTGYAHMITQSNNSELRQEIRMNLVKEHCTVMHCKRDIINQLHLLQKK